MAEQSNRDIFRPGVQGFGKSTAEPVAYAEGSGSPKLSPPDPPRPSSVDACGLQCPGPIMRLKIESDRVAAGRYAQVVRATDPGFARDAKAWCHLTGNDLSGIEDEHGYVRSSDPRRRGRRKPATSSRTACPLSARVGKEATFIVFSDDFDRALASFVHGQRRSGPGQEGHHVLHLLGPVGHQARRKGARVQGLHGPDVRTHAAEGQPENSPLSKKNFGGIGAAMMKGRMARRGSTNSIR